MNHRFRFHPTFPVLSLCWALVLSLLALASGNRVFAQATATEEAAEEKTAEQAPGAEWVRIQKDDKGRPTAMQVAIVRYKATDKSPYKGAVVDLVGAVHVGDNAYYSKLNDKFESYDALLYELVAPQGTVIERGTKASNRHALGAMQNGMKDMLKLEHQLEKVDYTKKNFVHADMSPDQFFQSMEDRGESIFTMYFRLIGQSIAQQSRMTAEGATPDIDMMKAMFAKDRSRQLKIAMAKQMAEMESLLTAFGGEEGSTLISERNKAALKVLSEQLDAGKRNIGIFYGAGHMSDMGERLEKEFHMEPVQEEWLDAWDLTAE
ncbi:hypothetical protein [Aeoliella mucimassa]|uniref:TraB family protein n=1 Tax=Aeoliella mucimassa TaxID=2527972 RepID=A0A518ALG3_9BACT|nr:hypothetical protein [Aeoliella mucimassa]QDU55551.1 hypothetical protein Pan181_17430 [Aeoliella mucimassa]